MYKIRRSCEFECARLVVSPGRKAIPFRNAQTQETPGKPQGCATHRLCNGESGAEIIRTSFSAQRDLSLLSPGFRLGHSPSGRRLAQKSAGPSVGRRGQKFCDGCAAQVHRAIIESVSTRAIIESALRQDLVDDEQKPVHARLLPGLSSEELDEMTRTLPVAPSRDFRELLEFCGGIEGTLEKIDFSGRTLRDGFEADFIPYGLPIAHDGFGNYWVVDLQPDNPDWAPIYFCCHDAPVVLLQSTSVEQFVSEVFKMYIPPHVSIVDDVHEDRLFDVWRKNPGVISHINATASADSDIQTFGASLGSDFEIIDLRNAPIGMGFSWGRYGPLTEVKRFGSLAIFAYRKPARKGLLSRLLGR